MFDDGVLIDSWGWKVDFLNIIIIMIFNLGVIVLCDDKIVGFGVKDISYDYIVM